MFAGIRQGPSLSPIIDHYRLVPGHSTREIPDLQSPFQEFQHIAFYRYIYLHKRYRYWSGETQAIAQLFSGYHSDWFVNPLINKSVCVNQMMNSHDGPICITDIMLWKNRFWYFTVIHNLSKRNVSKITFYSYHARNMNYTWSFIQDIFAHQPSFLIFVFLVVWYRVIFFLFILSDRGTVSNGIQPQGTSPPVDIIQSHLHKSCEIPIKDSELWITMNFVFYPPSPALV